MLLQRDFTLKPHFTLWGMRPGTRNDLRARGASASQTGAALCVDERNYLHPPLGQGMLR